MLFGNLVMPAPYNSAGQHGGGGHTILYSPKCPQAKPCSHAESQTPHTPAHQNLHFNKISSDAVLHFSLKRSPDLKIGIAQAFSSLCH